MQKHGIIENGKLVLTHPSHPGSKPIEYQSAPEYDQLTQAAVQTAPEDRGDSIYVGAEIIDIPLEEYGLEELPY